MRNRIFVPLAAVVCASLVACSTVATLGTDANTALNQLTAVHKMRDQAIAAKDTAAISRQHAAGLTVMLADGTKLDRSGFEALLRDKAEIVSPSHIKELTQEEGGYIAIVTPGLQGAGTSLRETWKRTGDGWKLTRVQEIPGTAAVASRNESKRPS